MVRLYCFIIFWFVSTAGCDGGTQSQPQPQPQPPASFEDPKIVAQYYGRWKTDCFYESNYFSASNLELTRVYKTIEFRISSEKVERIEQRFDDSTCEQYTGDSQGLNFYYRYSTSNYTVPNAIIDPENGALVGVMEEDLVRSQINDGNTVELSSSFTFGRLIYRSDSQLYAGQYAYELDRDVYPIDWINPYRYVGEVRSDL